MQLNKLVGREKKFSKIYVFGLGVVFFYPDIGSICKVWGAQGENYKNDLLSGEEI